MTSNSKPKLGLLGHGPFATFSFDRLKQEYKIVSPDEADCLIVANYGKILTLEEINRPRFKAINIHGSILPKYRGASPIQTALVNGDMSTGISLIVMDELVDHGPILATANQDIDPNDTTETLRKKLGQLAAPLLLKTLPLYFSGQLKSVPQDESLATFTQKISSQDSLLNESWSGPKLYNYYRAYVNEPGIFVQLRGGQLLKITKAKLIANQFIPLTVQRSGKKPMAYTDFLRGYRQRPPFLAEPV